MATCTSVMWKVLAGCQKQLLRSSGPAYAAVAQSAPHHLPIRTFAAVKTLKKGKKTDSKMKEKVIDDKDRRKPFALTAKAPVDDVYIRNLYPPTIYSAVDAIDMLKSFQALDFTPLDQALYVELRLNMKLEKKKKVDPFVSTVLLPHRFKTEMNKVLVFAEKPVNIQDAKANGAALVGGIELIQPILDDLISADFYIALPDMMPKLLPLKNKLRKKFPKNKRGTVGIDVPKMLALFTKGHGFTVEEDGVVQTQIATLNMPNDHIIANLQTILVDICPRRPAELGPFIEEATLFSQTSETILFNIKDILPEIIE